MYGGGGLFGDVSCCVVCLLACLLVCLPGCQLLSPWSNTRSLLSDWRRVLFLLLLLLLVMLVIWSFANRRPLHYYHLVFTFPVKCISINYIYTFVQHKKEENIVIRKQINPRLIF